MRLFEGIKPTIDTRRRIRADLRLGVRAGPVEFAGSAQFGDTSVQLVRQNNRQRHTLVGFVGGVAEHDSLVAGAHFVLLATDVHAVCDVRRLLLERRQHVARLVVETCACRPGVCLRFQQRFEVK